jgi:hypothetical protein
MSREEALRILLDETKTGKMVPPRVMQAFYEMMETEAAAL